MQLEAGAFYVHRARDLADLAGLGPSSLSRPCRRAHATDAHLCRFHSDVPACSSHICIMVCLTELCDCFCRRTVAMTAHNCNRCCIVRSILHCIAAFELRSHFALCSLFRLAQPLSPCTAAFALCSRFRLVQPLSPCAAAFALYSHFRLVQPFTLYSRCCLGHPL